ncbi:MAG TPA: cytochrome c3 family protein [Anaerolineales bacterium]|nr:cytochrome c3 family protein [Anaerolineales bacterium]
MAPLEPWEKALVDNEKFSQTTHGKQTCTDCHNGVQSADKDDAHEGLIASPSAQPDKYCGECHEEQTTTYPFALHSTQEGYWTAINARSVPENHPALEEMFGNHCASCHTTCGECHVSQPKNVGGGLFTGHVFEKTPPMTRSCTACHGSRVGNEFLGKNEGFPGDVHFREARMNCVKCHEGADLHGSATDAANADTHRYAGTEDPECVDCHPTTLPGGDENPMHQSHGDNLSCQVCHSITYTSCDGCHVAISQKSGNPFFETEATYSTFLIGRNPNPTEERPYKYVPVRHVPIAATSYQFYGENLLPNFDVLPTWMYATPHNIQRNTPQNASCEACHAGDGAIFLTADKIKAEEMQANSAVIVESLPPSLEIILNAPQMPATHADFKLETCLTCHGGGNVTTALPENHKDFENCSGCHKLQP